MAGMIRLFREYDYVRSVLREIVTVLESIGGDRTENEAHCLSLAKEALDAIQ